MNSTRFGCLICAMIEISVRMRATNSGSQIKSCRHLTATGCSQNFPSTTYPYPPVPSMLFMLSITCCRGTCQNSAAWVMEACWAAERNRISRSTIRCWACFSSLCVEASSACFCCSWYCSCCSERFFSSMSSVFNSRLWVKWVTWALRSATSTSVWVTGFPEALTNSTPVCIPCTWTKPNKFFLASNRNCSLFLFLMNSEMTFPSKVIPTHLPPIKDDTETQYTQKQSTHKFFTIQVHNDRGG